MENKGTKHKFYTWTRTAQKCVLSTQKYVSIAQQNFLSVPFGKFPVWDDRMLSMGAGSGLALASFFKFLFC